MRLQRRPGLTVELHRVTTATDTLGDSTYSDAVTIVRGALFEPSRVVESVDPNVAAVVESAAFNLPGVHNIDADDHLVANGMRWDVAGDAQVWLDRTRVPVKNARSV